MIEGGSHPGEHGRGHPLAQPGTPDVSTGPGMAGVPGPPQPPPGPGVRVPFGAPPSERNRKRLWIGLGVGAALLVLCCGGGIAGIGALLVQTSNELRDQATSVVSGYLDALRRGDFPDAYDRFCEDLRSQTGLSQFEAAEAGKPRVSTYSLDTPRPQGSSIWVQAEVQRADGQQESPDFRLVREGPAATSLKICEIAQ